jgi:two-component system OmpR family response regulator
MTHSILIVDDSTFIVEGLVALLKKSYNPIPSFGGEECLEVLRTVTPSLIILDIMMEPMDGWETLSRIKNNQKTRHIPVLMFSAKKISPEEAEAHRIIIDDFLTKPVNPKKLIEAIEKVLARQESNKRITGSWEAAGVSREIIDEYLTIKTNLDVDASLLAVMNKQLEMAHPDAENRGELEHSIAALEVRIAESQASLESFCREQGGVLPHPDHPESCIPLSASLPDMAPEQPAPADIPANAPLSGSPSPEIISRERAARVTEPPRAGPLPERVDLENVAEPLNPAPGNDIVPPLPEPAFQPAAPDSVSGSPRITPREAELQTAPVPAVSMNTNPDAAPVAGPEKPSDLPQSPVTKKIQPVHDSFFEPFDPAAGSVPAVHQEPVTTEPQMRVPPASRGVSGSRPPLAERPGGGTRTPSMKSPITTRREPPSAKEPSADRPVPVQPPAASGSFFSRLIAAITGLFTRKKP